MTICISAVATERENEKEKETIIFSTDHMISVGNLGQFEKEIKKYKILNKNTIAMLSGNTLLFDRILDGTDDFHDFYKIRNKILENFSKIRKEIIKREVYDLFNIDESYIKNILTAPIQNPFIQKILETTSEFSLQTNILLCGFDNVGKAQITEIDEKGHSDFRDIHFHAIGSGSTQALNTMLFQKHSKNHDVKSTIYSVYKAKRNAEVANGVGKETEVMILNIDSLNSLSQDKIEILGKIYEEELNHGIKHQDLNKIFPLRNNEKGGGYF